MVRELAWRILRSGSQAPLREVERAARESRLEPRDRALLRRLVGSEVRRRGTLRALVRKFGRGRPDPDLAAHLHLGLVQILFLDQIPDHAAVGESVSAAKRTLGARKGGYVNAVLRAALAARRPGASGDPRRDLPLRAVHLSEPVFADPAEHPLLWAEDALSIPAPLLRRWTRRHGKDRALALARSALVEPPLSLRARSTREEAAARLEALGCAPRPGLHPRILLVDSDRTEAVLASDAFARGSITVQGETALRAAEMLEARSTEFLLDACSAPGGKTAVLAETGARILACDVSLERLLRARGALSRLAPRGRAALVVCDAAGALVPRSFDGAIVDVPCSNTGVLAQRPEARWRFVPAAQRSLAALQERLLHECAERVRPGGRLVYSTCSLEPDENRGRVEAFLRERSGFELEAELESLPAPDAASGPVDGGYAARLRRT